MKLVLLLAFYIFTAHAQQTIDKLNTNQLKLPKESSNRALILDGAGQVKSSSTITDTELGYLEGLSDTLVNLLSGKSNDSDVVKLTGNQSVGGTKTFTGKLVAQSTINGSTPCPVMSETQRNAFTPAQGDCVYNSTTLKLNVFDGSVWKDAGGAGGISLWLSANPYNVNDIVIESDKIYRALIVHTSGTFATDLAANRWVEVSASPNTPYSLANGGTNKSLTAVNGGIIWVDADSFEVLSAGVSGQILQSNGAASPSWANKSISGKTDGGSSVTVEEFQVPGNQLTQTDTNKHRIETGNGNILANPSFEHSTVTTSWTSAVTGTAINTLTEGLNTTFELGAKRLNFSCAGGASGGVCSIRQDVNTSKAVQGIALAYLSTSSVSAVKLKPRVNAATVSGLEVSTQALTEALYKVPFILGTESSGIEIEITASAGQTITGTVDDTFVGAVDLKADVPTVIRDAVIDATNGAMTYSIASLAIKVSSTLTTLNRGVISVDNSGSTTKFVALKDCTVNISWTSNMATAGNSLFFRKNGTIVVTGTQSPSSNTRLTASGEFDLVKGDFLELYSSSTTTAGSLSLTAIHSEPGSVYSSTNADTDWASCGHVPADFTGFGTVTNIETQCKREGSDLLMRGKFTGGVATSVEARINLKLGGIPLTSSSSVTSLQLAGDLVQAFSSTTYFRNSVLIEPSVGYITFGIQTATLNAISKTTGSSGFTNSALSFTARIPISGWTNSNIIIGQFNGLESCTDSYECTDTFSAKISSAGTVTSENIEWISGNCSGTTTKSCTFTSGIFTVAPNCTTSAIYSGAGAAGTTFNTTTNSTSVTVEMIDMNNGAKNDGFNIICQKQGADYIGKTAKAVASDQNIATPGVTKVKACYYAFGGASATLASPTSCTTGTCTELYDTCGTGSVAFATTGAYTVTFSSGTFANTVPINCHETNANGPNSVYIAKGPDAVSNSSGGFSYTYFTYIAGGTTLTNTRGVLKCEGQAP
jgi:hypothetical protein